jgi:small-conductance mechanosensitive channel
MKTFGVVTGACAAAALALALAAAPGFGQVLPGAKSPAAAAPPGTGAQPPAASGAVDPNDVGAAIDRELAAAKAALEAIEASADVALASPPGTPAVEIAERLSLARQLVGVYQQQRDLLDRTEVARAARLDAEKAAQNWRGFATAPPHSVLIIDALRETEDNARSRIASAETRRALFERFSVEIGARTKASETAARLAAEAADRGRGTTEHAALEWRRSLTTLRARVDEATRQLLLLGIRNVREDIAAGEAAGDFARRQLAAAGHDLVLPPEDRARITAELDARRRQADIALDRAVRAAALARDARTAAEAELAQFRSAPAGAQPDAAARAAREDELARAAREQQEVATTTAQRVDLLKGYLIALDGERAAWTARAEALHAHDRVRSRAAYEQVTSSLATIRAWREFLNQQVIAVRDLVAEQETRLRTASDAEAAHARALLETYRQREGDVRQALERGLPLERLIAHFRADFETRREVSFAERARDAAAATLLWVRRIWNFELFTLEDSLQTAEGRTIAVERSVTVGKSVGAVLVVVLGYLLFSVIVRRIERMVVKRGHVAPQAAALIRSWILFLLTAILVIFALLGASIPLTAFAFLGGALAIAAGFGLQTVLKNFVAGIMLLFERPMRLGDLVEVDGIRGRVTAIGIRASTITSADGIETMIPNSTFVENRLTNWTYTSPQARHTIKVGVAYGTPLREAADAMQDVLSRHGLVLKDPAPQVYLEEYGDSAIVFTLAYWTLMTLESDSRRVKSDLLHMIDRAFAEAGIAMPFPQRDVHLDARAPLKVEVVGAAKPGGGGA